MVAWAVGGGNRLSWRPPCTTKVKIVLAFSIADRLSQFSARLLDAFTKLGQRGQHHHVSFELAATGAVAWQNTHLLTYLAQFAWQ